MTFTHPSRTISLFVSLFLLFANCGSIYSEPPKKTITGEYHEVVVFEGVDPSQGSTDFIWDFRSDGTVIRRGTINALGTQTQINNKGVYEISGKTIIVTLPGVTKKFPFKIEDNGDLITEKDARLKKQ